MRRFDFNLRLPLVVMTFLIAGQMSEPSRGDLIIQPTDIFSPQGEHPSFPLSQIIDQSGLVRTQNNRPTSYASGETDFAIFTDETAHISSNGAGAGTTNTQLSDVSPQQLTFDLGSLRNVNGLAMWGIDFGNQITQFELFSDDDDDFLNGTASQIGTSFSALKMRDPNPAQVFPFGQIKTRYVHMNILAADSFEPTRPGTGEIAFNALPIPPIDFNNDGTIDVNDLDLLVGEVVGNESCQSCDLSGDGKVDATDLVEWLSIAADQNGFGSAYLSGDANLDGRVDARDLNSLALNWQAENGEALSWSGGDFTADGNVNAMDLNELGLNWQRSIPLAAAHAVPEPAAVTMALFYLAVAIHRYMRSR